MGIDTHITDFDDLCKANGTNDADGSLNEDGSNNTESSNNSSDSYGANTSGNTDSSYGTVISNNTEGSEHTHSADNTNSEHPVSVRHPQASLNTQAPTSSCDADEYELEGIESGGYAPSPSTDLPSQSGLGYDTHQELTFTYAKEAFATAGIPWSDNALHDMHIMDFQNAYTRTALLISDQNPYFITCVLFEDDSKNTIVDRQRFHGSILEQTNATMAFFNGHNEEGSWPIGALQEALINAVLHRDYRYSGPIIINLFANRIEIVSLGGLVHGLEINDLLNGISQPRNVFLSELFESLHLSQNLGTGIPRIMDFYENSIVSPQLRVGPSSIVMVMPKIVTDSQVWPGLDAHSHTPGSDDANGDTRETDEDTTSQYSAKRYAFPVTHPYTTDETGLAIQGSRIISIAPLQILDLARSPASSPSQPLEPIPGVQVEPLESIVLHLLGTRGLTASRKDIQTSLHISKNQAVYALKKLEEQGKVTRIGNSRASRYKLND